MTRIRFLGATDTVTGSRYLLETDGARLLVDCGLFQGYKKLRERNWTTPPFAAASLDAVVLTHAHIDHSGYLPKLCKLGFKGRVHCTNGTVDLLKLLLPDSGYLQEEDARGANKYGYTRHHPAVPLYTQEDAVRSLSQLTAHPFDESFEPVAGVTASFSRAGHIIGSGCLRLQLGASTITFSGDVGRPNDPIMKPPAPLTATDYLVIESTYGDRRHPAEDVGDALAHVVNATPEDSKAIDRQEGPMIVISAAGMATGGRILHHLRRFLSDERNTVLFLGYQSAGTRGRALVDGADEVKIHGQYVKVKARVVNVHGLSAHADFEELIDWLRPVGLSPRRVFVTHGEPAAADAFRRRLRDEFGWDAVVPDDASSWDLEPGRQP